MEKEPTYLELKNAWLALCNKPRLTPIEKVLRDTLREAKTRAWIAENC